MNEFSRRKPTLKSLQYPISYALPLNGVRILLSKPQKEQIIYLRDSFESRS